MAIARCLILEPAVLLLDEPLGALDLKLREQMKMELKMLQARVGTTFIYITHDQSEALVMSDTVAVMHCGRFEQTGTPQQFYSQPQTPFVAAFVGDANQCPGFIEVTRGEVAVIRTDEGQVFHVRRTAGLTRGKATLFLRPESMIIAPADTAGLNTFQVEIRAILFDGAGSRLLTATPAGREVLIVLPHLDLLVLSFRGDNAWTLENYRNFFNEPIYWLTFVRTAVYAILTTVLTLLAPLVIPGVILGISILLGANLTGALLEERLGLDLEVLRPSFPLVVLGQFSFITTFVTLVVAARLRTFDRSLEEAALNLGASWPQVIWHHYPALPAQRHHLRRVGGFFDEF